MLNLFQHLDPKIRFAPKSKSRLVAVKTTLSVKGSPSPAERIKTRSRNKFGMTFFALFRHDSAQNSVR